MEKRALVIDDDAGIRDLVAAFLEPLGYAIIAAEQGEPGVLLATTEPPDLVLIDVMMPDMDGYEVCWRLRQHAKSRDIPVIMMTGSDDPALTRKAFAAGAQACVPKPFRRESLVATIQAVVAGMAPKKT